jgi:hypothetical protein
LFHPCSPCDLWFVLIVVVVSLFFSFLHLPALRRRRVCFFLPLHHGSSSFAIYGCICPFEHVAVCSRDLTCVVIVVTTSTMPDTCCTRCCRSCWLLFASTNVMSFPISWLPGPLNLGCVRG